MGTRETPIMLRGDSAAHDTHIGTNGTRTFNTETKSLHLHDGVTAGGFPTAHASENIASITKGVYYPNADPSIADHGASSGPNYDGGNIKSVIDDIGSEPAVIVLPKGDYNFITDITTPENVSFRFDRGAQFLPASGVKCTIYSPANITADINMQIFGGEGNVDFSSFQGDLHVMWFGFSESNTGVENSNIIQYLIGLRLSYTSILIPEGDFPVAPDIIKIESADNINTSKGISLSGVNAADGYGGQSGATRLLFTSNGSVGIDMHSGGTASSTDPFYGRLRNMQIGVFSADIVVEAGVKLQGKQEIHHCHIGNWSHGFTYGIWVADVGNATVIRHVSALGNQIGCLVRGDGTTVLYLDNVHLRLNRKVGGLNGDGLRVEHGAGLRLRNCVIEQNEGVGVRLYYDHPTTYYMQDFVFESVHIEANTDNQVVLDGNDPVVGFRVPQDVVFNYCRLVGTNTVNLAGAHKVKFNTCIFPSDGSISLDPTYATEVHFNDCRLPTGFSLSSVEKANRCTISRYMDSGDPSGGHYLDGDMEITGTATLPKCKINKKSFAVYEFADVLAGETATYEATIRQSSTYLMVLEAVAHTTIISYEFCATKTRHYFAKRNNVVIGMNSETVFNKVFGGTLSVNPVVLTVSSITDTPDFKLTVTITNAHPTGTAKRNYLYLEGLFPENDALLNLTWTEV